MAVGSSGAAHRSVIVGVVGELFSSDGVRFFKRRGTDQWRIIVYIGRHQWGCWRPGTNI